MKGCLFRCMDFKSIECQNKCLILYRSPCLVHDDIVRIKKAKKQVSKGEAIKMARRRRLKQKGHG